MSARLAGLAGVLLVLASAGAGAAPPVPLHPGPGGPPPAATPPETAPHRTGELDCRGCHVGEHRGIVRMYVGTGGRGAPMIPSHMFQVRVECIACHVAPKEEERRAGLVGQTFRPSEAACLSCHGERFRGMLPRWNATLVQMRQIVTPKVDSARGALAAAGAGHPRAAQVRRLVDDADFNVQFVALGRGVHNVFYAAELLGLANAWADEAHRLLGKAGPKTDDRLVRGGYCAVLCHEQAGVKQPETVSFGGRRLPHVRHVSDFGATCTSCHSPEIHKAVTARPATCAGCHHSPQNERCENCHRDQTAFYRGTVKTALAPVRPNLMADAVQCTGCHDWSERRPRAAIAEKCVGCHEPQYAQIMPEWTRGFRADLGRAAEAVRGAEGAVARARQARRPTAEAEALIRQAREALGVVRRGGAAHNPLATDALLRAAREKAAAAAARAGK